MTDKLQHAIRTTLKIPLSLGLNFTFTIVSTVWVDDQTDPYSNSYP